MSRIACPHQLGDRRVRRGPDLAGHHDQAGREQRLDRRPQVGGVGVVLHQVVQDGVADPVGDLVRVTLGHRLRGEETSRHVQLALWCRSWRKALSTLLVDQHAGSRSQAPNRRTTSSQTTWARADLVPSGTSTVAPSAARITAWLSSLPKTAPPLTSLTTSRSQPLRASLARARSRTRAGVVAGLGGEADDDAPGADPVVGDPGEHVGALLELQGRRSRRRTS